MIHDHRFCIYIYIYLGFDIYMFLEILSMYVFNFFSYLFIGF